MNVSQRREYDSLGEISVPENSLYGASTARALENFPISGQRVDLRIIHAYGSIKRAAAGANLELGNLSKENTRLIREAATEVSSGKLDGHFVVDVYQTGSGTSTNMNVNEVIANRCSEMADEAPGSKRPVHPNDHVNCGQSSNDTFPTALHLAVALALRDELLPSLELLEKALATKAEEFHVVLKIGRTHLMDATPIRLGQEFGGYRRQLEMARDRTRAALDGLMELPLGGTAVGTGINTHPDFARKTIAALAEESGLLLREAADHFEAQASKDALVEAHGQLTTTATAFFKIANDLRLMGSGPRCGLGELSLPAIQPGSSIMPGKVNPVMCESLTMVAARVFGNDTTVKWCGANGQLELNAFMPLLGNTVLESVTLLANGCRAFASKCVSGITANDSRCQELIELSLSMATSLVPLIGYDRAAEIAKESHRTGITVRELCERRREELGISTRELEKALDPSSMAGD